MVGDPMTLPRQMDRLDVVALVVCLLAGFVIGAGIVWVLA